MSFISRIKAKILSRPFSRNINSLRYEPLDLIYKLEDLNAGYYDKIKHLGDAELEHQIGRLTNFKKIIGEISSQNLDSEIVEFGTWKGFSLLWIAYLFERLAIFNKKIIGIDGFVGLPYDDGVFKRGYFNNASLKMTSRNIYANKNLYDLTKQNIVIKQALYSQKELILSKIRSMKFSFIHVDCDVSRSVIEIFEILRGCLLADKCYILFDDYGCESNLKHEVDDFIKDSQKIYKVTEHSNTKLTKNFKLEKIK